jgi:hypothetical protein
MRLSCAGTYRHCAATPWPPSDVASQAPTLADVPLSFFPVRTTVRWVDKPSDPGQSAGDPYNEFPVEILKSEWVFALEILGGRLALVGVTLPKDVPVLQMTPEIGLVFVRKVVVPRGACRHRFAGCYSSPETKLAPQHSAATEGDMTSTQSRPVRRCFWLSPAPQCGNGAGAPEHRQASWPSTRVVE